MAHAFTKDRAELVRRAWRAAAALAVLLLLSPFGRPQDTAASPSTRTAPDSPRAALQKFLDLGREAQFEEAGRLLELPAGTSSAEAGRLARRLKFVLDRYILFDLSQVSGEPQGRLDDGLTPDTEEIGLIQLRRGADEPVRLVRVTEENGARWLFSAATVARIDHWYGTLRDRWILEHLPKSLLQPGPFDLLCWQWLALPVAVLGAWFLGFFFARILRASLARVVARTRATWDDAVLERIGGPLTLTGLVAALYAVMPLLGLAAPAEDAARQFLRAGLFVVVFWALLRSVDVLVRVIQQSQWTVVHPAAWSLIPLAGRLVKMLVLVLAVVSGLSALGFPVASLLAGIGIGGLAVALAAQKSVENLVGAFSIGVDQAFKEGDLIKIGEHQGHVETIGLRSTRLRTLDRTLVTIPNSQVSEQRVESFAARDRIRLALTVGIEYGATRAQILQIVSGFEGVLRGHPRIWPDTVVVRFTNFGESSLDIEVMCWTRSGDQDEYRDFRQEVLLGFMDVVEKAGSGFAFPTRTVHVFEHETKGAGRTSTTG